jgi:hypothetical protein
VTSASFSPDSQWVVTASGGGEVRVCEAQSGRPVNLPLKQSLGFSFANFSPDSKWIVTDWDDGTARIWDVIVRDSSAPAWLGRLAESAGGKLLANGRLEADSKTLADLRSDLEGMTGTGDLDRFGRWYYGDPSKRTLGPLSPVTVPVFVAKGTDSHNPRLLELTLNADAGDALALAEFARLEFNVNKDVARFHIGVALRYATLDGPPSVLDRVKETAKAIGVDDFSMSR